METPSIVVFSQQHQPPPRPQQQPQQPPRPQPLQPPRPPFQPQPQQSQPQAMGAAAYCVKLVAQVVLVASEDPNLGRTNAVMDETGRLLAAVAPPELEVHWWVTWELTWARHLLARCEEPAMVLVAVSDGRLAVETARLLREDTSRLKRPPAFVALVHPSLANMFAAARTFEEMAAVDTWGYMTSGCFDEIVAAPVMPTTAHSLVSRILRPRAFLPGQPQQRAEAVPQQLRQKQDSETVKSAATTAPKRPRTTDNSSSNEIENNNNSKSTKGPPRFALVKRIVRRMLLWPYPGKEPEDGLKVAMCDPALALMLGYDDPTEIKDKDFVENCVFHDLDSDIRTKVLNHFRGCADEVCLCLVKKTGGPSTPFMLRARPFRRAGNPKPVLAHLVPCSEEAALLKHRQLWALKETPPPDPYVRPRFKIAPGSTALDSPPSTTADPITQPLSSSISPAPPESMVAASLEPPLVPNPALASGQPTAPCPHPIEPPEWAQTAFGPEVPDEGLSAQPPQTTDIPSTT